MCNILACFCFALHKSLTSWYHDEVVPGDFWWSAAVLCPAPLVLPYDNRAESIILFNYICSIFTTISCSINMSLHCSAIIALQLLSNKFVVTQMRGKCSSVYCLPTGSTCPGPPFRSTSYLSPKSECDFSLSFSIFPVSIFPDVIFLCGSLSPSSSLSSSASSYRAVFFCRRFLFIIFKCCHLANAYFCSTILALIRLFHHRAICTSSVWSSRTLFSDPWALQLGIPLYSFPFPSWPCFQIVQVRSVTTVFQHWIVLMPW